VASFSFIIMSVVAVICQLTCLPHSLLTPRILISRARGSPDVVVARELLSGLEKDKSARVGFNINSIRQNRFGIRIFGPWLVVKVNRRALPLNL
jgi:hypothetical protein